MTIVIGWGMSALTRANEVWVFTAQGGPTLKGLGLANRHFVLPRGEASLDALTFPNPGSDDAARQMAAAQIQTLQGKALLERIKASSEAKLMATLYGIERLPAVLVDEAYVVYGGADVHEAMASIAAYRHRKGR